MQQITPFRSQLRETVVNGTVYRIQGEIFEFKPCVKLWIGFKPEYYKPRNSPSGGEGESQYKTSKTLYMPELRNSVEQIMYREHEPIIDWEFATNRAIHLVNDYYHGKYRTAIIGFETQLNAVKKERIMYYYCEGKLVDKQSQPFDFNSHEWQVFKKKYQEKLAHCVKVSEMVVDYQNNRKVNIRSNFNPPTLF